MVVSVSCCFIALGCMNTPESSPFTGTWSLVTFEGRLDDGQIIYPLGQNASGRISYTSGGLVAVHLMKADRPKFTVSDKSKGTAEEIKAAFVGYEAYFGYYIHDETQKTVTHILDGALFPNWEGSQQKRYYEITNNQLTLRTDPTPYMGKTLVGVLVWERME